MLSTDAPPHAHHTPLRWLRRLAGALLAATALVLVATTTSAWAGHGRGTTLSISVDTAGTATAVLDIRQSGSCTVGQPAGGGSVELFSLDAPGGTRTSLGSFNGSGVCHRTAGGFIETRSAISIPMADRPDGWYVVRHTGNAKVSGIVNVNGGASATQWSSEAQFRKQSGTATGAPAFGVDLPFAASIGHEYNQNLNAADPDGGPVTARSLCCQTTAPDFAVSFDVIEVDPAATPGAEVVGQQIVIPASTTATLTPTQFLEFKVRATDDEGEYADLDMVLSPTTNVPPSFDPAPATTQAVAAGAVTTLPLRATDPDASQSVSFALSGQPSWLTVEQVAGNPATGTLTLSPPAGTSGTFVVNLNASDDDPTLPATASRTLTITVNPAAPPQPRTGSATPVVIRDGRPVTAPVFTGATPGGRPLISLAATESAHGSWATTAAGEVYTAGDAPFYGSLGGMHLNAPIAAITPTLTGRGYYLVGEDGGVFAFGDATFHGSMATTPLNQPVTGIVAACDGDGYYLVASDGGVFAFGGARFAGSMGGSPLNKQMLGIVPDCGRTGYWTYAADGGVFAFGQARFFGSLGATPPAAGVASMAVSPDGSGYWLITGDGSVHPFGSAGR